MKKVNDLILIQIAAFIIGIGFLLMIIFFLRKEMMERGDDYLYYTLMLCGFIALFFNSIFFFTIKNRPIIYECNNEKLILKYIIPSMKKIIIPFSEIEKIFYCKIDNNIFIKYTLIIIYNNNYIIMPIVPSLVFLNISKKLISSKMKEVDVNFLRKIGLDPVGGEMLMKKMKVEKLFN